MMAYENGSSTYVVQAWFGVQWKEYQFHALMLQSRFDVSIMSAPVLRYYQAYSVVIPHDP
jgi:hypothetical protein